MLFAETVSLLFYHEKPYFAYTVRAMPQQYFQGLLPATRFMAYTNGYVFPEKLAVKGTPLAVTILPPKITVKNICSTLGLLDQ